MNPDPAQELNEAGLRQAGASQVLLGPKYVGFRV